MGPTGATKPQDLPTRPTAGNDRGTRERLGNLHEFRGASRRDSQRHTNGARATVATGVRGSGGDAGWLSPGKRSRARLLEPRTGDAGGWNGPCSGPTRRRARNPRALGLAAPDRSLCASKGDRIGWVSGGDLFLDPVASHRAAQEIAGSEHVPMGAQTIRRRLHERGLLRSVDGGRQMLLVRRVLGDSSREVLHLSATDVIGPADPQCVRS